MFAAYDAKLPWFGTVRGRLGYSVGSNIVLRYRRLRLWQRQDQNFHAAFLGSRSSRNFNQQGRLDFGRRHRNPLSTSSTCSAPNWTSKTEYLYVDLGTSTGSFGIPVTGGPVVTATNSTQVHEHIFRTGLNYHFNSPVVARY